MVPMRAEDDRLVLELLASLPSIMPTTLRVANFANLRRRVAVEADRKGIALKPRVSAILSIWSTVLPMVAPIFCPISVVTQLARAKCLLARRELHLLIFPSPGASDHVPSIARCGRGVNDDGRNGSVLCGVLVLVGPAAVVGERFAP